VTSVKSTIDGMRATRDEQMGELNRLKTVLKQQNQRLVALSQQKSKLEAQGKFGKDVAGEEQARIAFNNKQVTIKNLKEKIADLEEQVIKSNIFSVVNN
jgi:N-acetyl-beta-hexosaminidase